MGVYRLNDLDFHSNMLWGKPRNPMYAYVEITEKCNCQCSYCQIDSPRNKDMDWHLFCHIVDEMTQNDIFELRIGGGEPLMCESFYPMVEKAIEMKRSVWVCTNGYMLSKRTAHKLLSMGIIGVKISLDATIPTLHDRYRGFGSWHHAMKAMFNALSMGLQVTANSTVSKHNIADYEAMIQLSQVMGFSVATHFVMPVGRGISQFNINNTDDAYQDKHTNIVSHLGGDVHCSAGSDMFAIDIEGNLRPCLFGRSIANIREMTLDDIIRSEPYQRYLKKVSKNKCYLCEWDKVFQNEWTCPMIAICRGGCHFFYEQSIAD